MEFSKEKAKEIIEKHNLNSSLEKVWKNRGKIPSQYTEDYSVPQSLSKIELEELEVLITILRLSEIKTSYFDRKLQGKKRIDGYIQKNNPLWKHEFIILKKELNLVRLQIKKIIVKFEKTKNFSDREVKEVDVFISQQYFHTKNLFKTPLAYERHINRRTNKHYIYGDNDIRESLNGLTELLLKTSL